MTVPVAAPALLLAFDASNQLAVYREKGAWAVPLVDDMEKGFDGILTASFSSATRPRAYYRVSTVGGESPVYLTQVAGPRDEKFQFLPLDQLLHDRAEISPELRAALDALDPFLIEIPYLHLGENDYIYKFRVEKDRNRSIYQQDQAAQALYQSRLCEAIKALARTNERSASKPAVLDFGAVQFVIPSHFGFCLGVKNAIERAYESLAENPGHRVFMLSELIHNPFVNEDLLQRGLRYLQTDKGVPFTVHGKPAKGETAGDPLLWDMLTTDDVVIIPAFGATDEDKKRLVRKGIRVAQYDATCMLVEKVWKAARHFGREGFTIVIHGKSEHEETKATFSNARRYAPCLIIRNESEARLLGDYILQPSPEKAAAVLQRFRGLATPDFDPARHLDRVAIVNQTTLLMNETSSIIDYFRDVFVAKYGEAEAASHIGGAGKKDTLCYATQVNQDALRRSFVEGIDAAFIIGGKNSSNTYQLYRVCEERLGEHAFFIQSERNIRSLDAVEHYIFPATDPRLGGHIETKPMRTPDGAAPRRILLTGGASCPDGLIQQVIGRLCEFYPANSLRPIDAVIRDLEEA